MPLDWVSKEEHVYTWAASAMSQAEEILGPLGLPVNCSVKSITIRVRERERDQQVLYNLYSLLRYMA